MKGTLAGKALQALTTPSISLPAYGTIIDQQTGVKHKFDPTKITHDLQNTLVAYASNPPKDELGQSAWLALLGYRQGGKSLTAELVGYPKAAYIPGFDHVCIADRKDRADYLHRRLHINHKNWPEEIRSPTRASNEVRQLTFDPAVGGIMRTLSGEQGAVGIGQSPDFFHGCLHPDTPVLSWDGTLVYLRDIQPGDWIRTHTGARAQVAKKWYTHRPTLELRVASIGVPLVCSPDHKHWTQRGMVPAGELLPTDRIGFPRVVCDKPTRTKLNVPKVPTGFGREPTRHLPDRMSATKAWGRLFGLYLAEGSIRYQHSCGTVSGVMFSVHSKEVPRTLAWLDAVGLTGKVNYLTDSLTAHVKVHSRQVGEFFKAYLGETRTKHWPEHWWTYQGSFLDAMVEGYLDGDGSYDTSGTSPRVRVTAAYPQLVLTLREVALFVGLGWGTLSRKEAGVRAGRNEQEAWTLTFDADRAREIFRRYGRECPPKVRWTRGYPSELIDDDFVWLKVESITPGPEMDLIDIEVDHPDHSFTLVHGATSNSEIPYWSDAEGQYSLIYPSMINRDHALMVLESTPAPMDEPSAEWWKDHCRDAKNGAGRWIYAFFPFWDGKLNRRPWPKNSPMDTEEIRLMERYGHLGLTMENLAFRRLMLESDTQLRRNPDLFPCYYPFDDVTCWPMSGRSVIHKSVVERHLNHARVPWEGTHDWHYQEYEPYDPSAIYVVCVDPIGWGARDHGSFHVLKLYVGEWTQVACGSGVTDPVMLVDEVHKVSQRYGRAPIAVERNGPGEGFIAALIKDGANVYWEDRNKPGVWKSSDDQMLAFLIDALKEELVLHDMDTVSQIASYKNDKKIQQSVKAEMMSSGRKSKRRGRHHWDKVSALAVGCAAARNMPRRYKRGAPPEEPDNVVLFKDMTWAQVEEYRKTVYKEPRGPVRRKSRYRSTRRRRK